jgi:hypothetical protein
LKPGPVPPEAGGETAGGKAQDVPRIRHANIQKQRADDFAHYGPDGKMKQHFPPAGRTVMLA